MNPISAFKHFMHFYENILNNLLKIMKKKEQNLCFKYANFQEMRAKRIFSRDKFAECEKFIHKYDLQ